MSQGQPQRPERSEKEPIRYGDLFNVSDKLAKEAVAPKDAATMQEAEKTVLGRHTQKDSPAALVISAADINERCGVLRHNQATSVIRDEGVTISEAQISGCRIITEAIGGEVVGQYSLPKQVGVTKANTSLDSPFDPTAVTIGEALEAAAHSAGDKVVDEGDAAAIQTAEVRATGRGSVVHGGITAQSQSAASHNAYRTTEYEEKINLGDDARSKLVDDKAVTREDAEGVIGAESRNRPDLITHPGGVAASVAAAARVNKYI